MPPWSKDTVWRLVMTDQLRLPAMNSGGGINTTVIAACHSGSETDSGLHSEAAAEANYTGRESEGPKYFISSLYYSVTQ